VAAKGAVMQAWVDAIIGFVEQHQALAPWLMLVFAMAETTAVISIVVPSTAIMVAVGALAATGAINFLPLWLGATVGAVLGSTLSFWLGRRYGAAILATPLLRDHPETGWKRPTRRLCALRAGHHPDRPFHHGLSPGGVPDGRDQRHDAGAASLFWNVLGCVSWAFLIPKLGQFGGDI
jgi:membrane protein DedA with SNARE-associated domain